MTQVDFYILPEASPNTRPLFACRLADKVYRLGHRVYLHVDSREQARALDDLLWTFDPDSFVPHALHPPPPEDASPVLIGHDLPPPGMAVLINLAAAAPAFYRDFQRVAELVDQRPEMLADGRVRFKFYKDQGIAPNHHKL